MLIIEGILRPTATRRGVRGETSKSLALNAV